MVRSVVGRVMWLGRATVFLVGLAMILALVIGAATAAFGAVGDAFTLGRANSAANKMTSLSSSVADALKSTLLLKNTGGTSALEIKVGNAGVPANDVAPMKVNSNKVVSNLNADTVDGFSSEQLQGQQGPEGTAVGYADVNADLGDVFEGWSKNVSDGQVTKRTDSGGTPLAGQYCFHDLSFSPKSAVANHAVFTALGDTQSADVVISTVAGG